MICPKAQKRSGQQLVTGIPPKANKTSRLPPLSSRTPYLCTRQDSCPLFENNCDVDFCVTLTILLVPPFACRYGSCECSMKSNHAEAVSYSFYVYLLLSLRVLHSGFAQASVSFQHNQFSLPAPASICIEHSQESYSGRREDGVTRIDNESLLKICSSVYNGRHRWSSYLLKRRTSPTQITPPCVLLLHALWFL